MGTWRRGSQDYIRRPICDPKLPACMPVVVNKININAVNIHSMMTSSMETFSALLALCVCVWCVCVWGGGGGGGGDSPVTKAPVTRSFDVYFDLRLNKRLSKQSWGCKFETPSHPLWRHCNAVVSVRGQHVHDLVDCGAETITWDT